MKKKTLRFLAFASCDLLSVVFFFFSTAASLSLLSLASETETTRVRAHFLSCDRRGGGVQRGALSES